jgi:uncharacterized membrane protein YqaE (UPF0057 family)
LYIIIKLINNLLTLNGKTNILRKIIKGYFMIRLILAILIPWLNFFTIGKPISGIICLILQLTLIGWIPAAIWSVYALSQYNTDKKIRESLRKS